VRTLQSDIMIEGLNAVTQALLGTLLTWGLTALGAGLVIFLRGNHVST
jgi:solute carrier family 39 (zinc transporter), member 11